MNLKKQKTRQTHKLWKWENAKIQKIGNPRVTTFVKTRRRRNPTTEFLPRPRNTQAAKPTNSQIRKPGTCKTPTTTNARNLKMFIRAFRATGIPRSGVSDGSIDSLSSETAETACSESQNRRFFIFVLRRNRGVGYSATAWKRVPLLANRRSRSDPVLNLNN
jgi:hypothetical protein